MRVCPLPRLRRLLFVPGNRPDRFDKARASGAAVVCIDGDQCCVMAPQFFSRHAADGIAMVSRQLATAEGIAPVEAAITTCATESKEKDGA